MNFNGKMKRQEALSKEDVQLLEVALSYYVNSVATQNNKERLQFLTEKLERMRKAFRS